MFETSETALGALLTIWNTTCEKFSEKKSTNVEKIKNVYDTPKFHCNTKIDNFKGKAFEPCIKSCKRGLQKERKRERKPFFHSIEFMVDLLSTPDNKSCCLSCLLSEETPLATKVHNTKNFLSKIRFVHFQHSHSWVKWIFLATLCCACFFCSQMVKKATSCNKKLAKITNHARNCDHC